MQLNTHNFIPWTHSIYVCLSLFLSLSVSTSMALRLFPPHSSCFFYLSRSKFSCFSHLIFLPFPLGLTVLTLRDSHHSDLSAFLSLFPSVFICPCQSVCSCLSS